MKYELVFKDNVPGLGCENMFDMHNMAKSPFDIMSKAKSKTPLKLCVVLYNFIETGHVVDQLSFHD